MRLLLTTPAVLPSGLSVGGMPAYFGPVEGDIFNGSNLIIGVRAGAGGIVSFAVEHQAQGWTDIEPFGDVTVDGANTLFVLPHEILDAADGLGWAMFCQAGDVSAPGTVGAPPGPASPAFSMPGTSPSSSRPRLPDGS